MTSKTLESSYKKIKDAEIRYLIDAYVKGRTIDAASRIAPDVDDWVKRSDRRWATDYFDAHEKALRILFGDYYDAFREYLGEVGYFYESLLAAVLEQMIFISNSGFSDVRPESITCMRDWIKATELFVYDDIGDMYFRSFRLVKQFYEKAVADGRLSVEAIIEFCRKRPDLLGMFIDILSGSSSAEAADYFCELIATAGLTDTVRVHIFASVFMGRGRNKYLVGRVMDRVRKEKWYKLPAFSQTLVYADGYVKLPIEKRVRIVNDALNGNFERYYGGNVGEFFFLADALASFDPDGLKTVVSAVLDRGDAIMRRAALFAAAEFAHDLAPYKAKIIEIKDALDFEDWAIISVRHTREQLCDPKIISKIFEVLDAMPKSSVNYKSDAVFNFPRNLQKDKLVDMLSDFYDITGDKNIVRELEKRYDTLNVDAQTAFLNRLEKVTELDVRKATVAFLKSTNYYAKVFYEKKNIVLTYAEAVTVSDYLKTKRQETKSRIITEFLKSRDREKIAKYLSEQPEDYKTAAAAEMYGAMGKTAKTAVVSQGDKTQSRTRKSAFERPKELDKLLEIKAPSRKFGHLDFKRAKGLLDKLYEFVKDRYDSEYKSLYGETVWRFGIFFGPLAQDGEKCTNAKSTDTLTAYPFGEELGAIFREAMSAEELAIFKAAFTAAKRKDGSAKRFGKLFGCEKTIEYLIENRTEMRDGRNTVMDIVRDIPDIVLRETDPGLNFELWLYMSEFGLYIGEDHNAIESYIEYVKNIDRDKLMLFVARRTDRDYSAFRAALEKKKTAETDDLYSAYREARDERFDGEYFTVSCEAFAELYENGGISDALAEYMILTEIVSIGGFVYEQSAAYIGADNKYPKTSAFVRGYISDMVDAECKRGSLPTRYSGILRRVRKFFGAENYFKAVVALRGLTPSRGYYLDTAEKPDSITHILRCSVKDRADSYEEFERLCGEYGATEEELIRAAIINPVYIEYTEKYLGMKGLKMTVYWFTAHLNEEVDDERKEKIKEFSEIDAADFKDGAFDFKWYTEMVNTVAESDIRLVYDNAKYITIAGLHKRAQRFFDAINGKITLEECKEHIEKSRNKDYCLAYSLIPVKDRKDLIARYEYLAEFLRLGKNFGAMRRASERRTVDIALENLARAAGYTDVNIFIYETEAMNPSTLFRKHDIDGMTVVPAVDGYRVTLAAEKDGRLEKLPAAIAKNKQAAELKAEAKKETARIKRMRAGFERSMCERVEFTAEQLQLICKQPVIDYLLSRLVFIADGRAAVLDGGRLKGLDGAPIEARTAVIAHPVELKSIGALRDCITYIIKNNVKQPFKQVLREIYEPTDDEKNFGELLRFKGFNVSIKKCFAALKGRGWAYSPDVGTRRVFYSANTLAVIFRDFDLPYTYDFAEDDRELDCVLFFDRKSGETISIKDVDRITFSETCRDVDLAVALSANNVYDFENAMSTVEVRKNILVSLCDILHLRNVGFSKDNIKITGAYGTYVVNIRTGLVFKEGAGNLAISTVHTGKKPILLDFVDEDPVTADIISKALILSDDANIKDNAILSQVKK